MLDVKLPTACVAELVGTVDVPLALLVNVMAGIRKVTDPPPDAFVFCSVVAVLLLPVLRGTRRIFCAARRNLLHGRVVAGRRAILEALVDLGIVS